MLKAKAAWRLALLVASFTLLPMTYVAAQEGGPPDSMPEAHNGPHIFSTRGGSKSTGKLLVDHGGPVLPISNVHGIYWGSFGSSDIPAALGEFFSGFGSSHYSNISTQYMRGASNPQASYTTLVNDFSSPPSSSPSVGTIVNEACSAISGAGRVPDAIGIYVVATSNFPNGANYCGWHSFGTCGSQTIAVVYLPNVTGVSGCLITPLAATNTNFPNPYSASAQSMANIAAHEMSETITDQQLSAWFDSSGQEIGDKCAWMFSNPVATYQPVHMVEGAGRVVERQQRGIMYPIEVARSL